MKKFKRVTLFLNKTIQKPIKNQQNEKANNDNRNK